MIFQYIFNKTPLHLAVEKGNTEIVKLLISNKNLDINQFFISKEYFCNKILFDLFNQILFQFV